MEKLTQAKLKEAIAGPYAAIRSVTRLEPVGGPADKLFPPTFVKEGQSETKYAIEPSRIRWTPPMRGRGVAVSEIRSEELRGVAARSTGSVARAKSTSLWSA